MHLQSWEFLFILNITAAFLFPFIARGPRWILGGCHILPYILAVIENIFFDADLSFHFRLIFFHWNISLLALHLLYRELGFKKSFKKFYAVLFISLLFSALTPLLTRSIRFIDLFWGVVPGTISIDPIISLEPYYFRALWFLGLAILAQRTFSTRFFTAMLLAIPLFVGIFSPYGFTFLRSRNKIFLDRAETNGIRVYQNQKNDILFGANVWLQELRFNLAEIQARIPAAYKFKTDPQLQVYVYASDDEKAAEIGARQTQIGHFLRNEMHLSQTLPFDDVVAHEMVHLIHGQMSAPFKSYIDPFYLEGFAVALSAASLDEPIAKAAALFQEKDNLNWPRGINFFSLYPPAVSYTLAGAHTALALQENTWPWLLAPLSKDAFQNVAVTDREKLWAKKALEVKPLSSDPRRRDCARLQWEFSKSQNESLRQKILRLCPSWPEKKAYRAELTQTELLEMFLKQYEIEAVKKVAQDFYESLALGHSPLSNEKLVKLIEELKNSPPDKQPNKQTARLKKRIEWELTQRLTQH